jgi:hypothetical protein
MRVPGVFLIPLVALLVPVCVLAEEEQGPNDLVEFSTQLSDTALTIKCKPRSEEIAKSDDWIGQCNELGRAALDSAAASGQIVPVEGPAFGVASQFLKKLPASVSVSDRNMSREIPLLVKSS